MFGMNIPPGVVAVDDASSFVLNHNSMSLTRTLSYRPSALPTLPLSGHSLSVLKTANSVCST